jgi:hypothetical protein
MTITIDGVTRPMTVADIPALEAAILGPTVSPPARPAPVAAQWTVELNCDCPKCGEYVDLLEYPDFWDGRKLEIAEHDTERSRAVEVACPECDHVFEVECRY